MVCAAASSHLLYFASSFIISQLSPTFGHIWSVYINRAHSLGCFVVHGLEWSWCLVWEEVQDDYGGRWFPSWYAGFGGGWRSYLFESVGDSSPKVSLTRCLQKKFLAFHFPCSPNDRSIAFESDFIYFSLCTIVIEKILLFRLLLMEYRIFIGML